MSPEVRPDRPGSWRFELHEALSSTNDHCIARAETGEPDGLAVLAKRQTGARGSRGRSWTEPPRGNLALSVLLRPSNAAEPGLWPFVAGLALLDGLETVSSASLMLKWPNDVLLADRKLAGILIERGWGPDGVWMVIGFGANLLEAPVLPDRAVACLSEVGPAPSQEEAAAAVLAALDRWRSVFASGGFEPIRQAWLKRAHPLRTLLRVGVQAPVSDGETLAQPTGRAQREGSFSGIAPDGALLLLVDGREQRVETGDVLLLGGCS